MLGALDDLSHYHPVSDPDLIAYFEKLVAEPKAIGSDGPEAATDEFDTD